MRLKNILSTTLVKNTLKLSSSNVILYFLPLIVTPILSRIYTPSYFGEWGIFSSTSSIIQVVMFGSYDNAIIKANAKEANNLSCLCIIIGLVISILSFAIFILGEVSGWSFFIEFPYKWMFFCGLLINIFVVVFNNKLNRESNYNALTIGNLLNGVSQAAIRLTWGFFIKIYNGLIIGNISAHLINAIYLISRSKSSIRNNVTIESMCTVAKKYKNFPLFDAPALLLQFAALNLPIIILSFFFSRSDIGCYSLIIQLLILPIAFIGSAMGKVYYQEVTSESADISSNIKRSTIQVFRILSFLCVIPCLFIGVGGDKLIVTFLGSKWEMAGNMAICLAIWSIPTILTEPLKSLFRVKDAQRQYLYLEILYFIAGIGSLIISCYCSLNIYSILTIYTLLCTGVRLLILNKIFNMSETKFSMFPLGAKLLIGCTSATILGRLYFILF